jgi:electron transport complex protein RnfG
MNQPMNETNPASPPDIATTPASSMLRTLGLVATLSGLLVVLSFRFTLPYIEENKRQAIEKALYQVVPGAVSRRDFVFDGEAVKPAADGIEGTAIYAGYDDSGKLRGVAMEAAAPGYQDVVRILYGYDPHCQCIRGFVVLKMAETPGIGDKIVKDKEFQKNFEALQAKPNADGTGLENPITLVKKGAKTNPWEIDAISGATISSRAVAKMLNDSSQRMSPIIQRNLSVLESES